MIAPVPFSRLVVFQILIEELTKLWEDLQGDTATLIEDNSVLLQQIADLFPRLDSPQHCLHYGWDTTLLSTEKVQEMFLYQTRDGNDTEILPGTLIKLHQSSIDSDAQPQEPPKEGDDIDDWNPPVKSCGDAEVDLIGQLTSALGASEMLALYDRFDLNTINLLVQAYNYSQETPEDRRKQYLAESYQKYKKQNPDIMNKALGLNASDLDLTKMFAGIVKPVKESDE